MADKPEWEDFAEGVSRMKIDGGWLYITPKGLVFVPDPPEDSRF
jgi:hypothetical protein